MLPSRIWLRDRSLRSAIEARNTLNCVGMTGFVWFARSPVNSYCLMAKLFVQPRSIANVSPGGKMESVLVPTYLRRYTDLPALLYMLSEKRITLLDPKTWDDRNDSFFMSLYRERKSLKTLLALCFSQTAETYHHWRVFSNGPAGVCIVFDREALLQSVQTNPGLLCRGIEYLTLRAAKARGLKVEELPFVKRIGFKPEKEFRVVFESSDEELSSLEVPIEITCIRSISLSPWMHPSLSKSTAAAIRAIDGCSKLKVSRSTLISNDQWKSLGKNAT